MKINEAKVSNMGRYRGELQSVECAGMIASEWAFEVLKNYRVPGAKAGFTMNTDTGEIAALGIVENTKTSQVSHLLRQVLSRPNFLPRGLWTDMWPKGKVYWEAMLGETIHGRLGLFHFMKRIVDTLRPNHDEFWTALVSLKECVYQYKPDDYQALIETLKSGTMSSSGYRYSDHEIHELRHSKRWHQRYDKYLEKIVFPPGVA